MENGDIMHDGYMTVWWWLY